MPRARMEVLHDSPFSRQRGRDGRARTIAAGADCLSYLLGQRTGFGDMTRAATAVTEMRIFAGSLNEVRNVRSFIGQVMQGCPVADDIVLLASELAANAVVHTASGADGTFSVGICADVGRIRVEVHDLGSAKAPTVHDSAATAEKGRGLCLVEMIATRWGYSGGQRGRMVWFEVEWK